jgi:kinetochore protein NDC80
MSRRTTLGSVSQSAVNSRAGRASLGPARISNSAGGDGIVKPPRVSLSVASSSSVPALSSRTSIGVGNSNSAVGASRRSSVGVPRKSSLQATGRQSMATSTRVTDPRNISDKQFMNASIRGLIDYLTQHNFDHAISPKILTRPAVKDFNNIIMFLFKQLDPNYVSTGKFEEEVVSVFKLLGYPCQISKANIAAVGSPHAWPSLLASIMWLIELLAYDEEADIGSSNESDNDDKGFEDNATLTDKTFYPYLSKAYTLFLSGDDDKYSELEEKFVSTYEDKNVLIRDQIAALEQRNVSLTREIEEVEGRRAYLPELESKRTAYQSDLGKFRLLIEQLQKHKDQLETKTTSREIELEKVNSSVELVQNEIANLRERIAGQEISPEDVKRMISEREKLEDAQQQASEARQLLQRKVWESEMALRDQV